MRFHQIIALGAAAALTLALFAACGGGGDDPTSTPAPTQAPAATAEPTAAMPANTPTPSADGAGSGTTRAAATPTPSPRATATPVPPPPGFDADEYFGGKTIRIKVGASPGGGYDVFSRIVAATAEKYFPESTRFVVQNLPGAGQYRGLRAVLDSEPDGLTIGPTHSRWFARQLLVGDVPAFDIDAIHILGSPTFAINEDGFCVDRSVATSWQDILDKGITIRVGSAAAGNEPALEFLQQNGGPFQLLYGYGGTSDIMAAFDRGEVTGTNRCSPGTAGRLYPEWIDEGRLVPLFYEKKPYNAEWLARLGHTGELPSFRDLPGLEFDPAQAAALEINLLVTEISRVFFLPPGVPDDVRQYWQSAFDQMMVDAEFRESVNIAGYTDDYGYGRAEDILEIVEVVRAADAETRAIALELSGVGSLSVN